MTPNRLSYYGKPARCGDFIATIMQLGGVIVGVYDHGLDHHADQNSGWTSVEFTGALEAVQEFYKAELNLQIDDHPVRPEE